MVLNNMGRATKFVGSFGLDNSNNLNLMKLKTKLCTEILERFSLIDSVNLTGKKTRMSKSRLVCNYARMHAN